MSDYAFSNVGDDDVTEDFGTSIGSSDEESNADNSSYTSSVKEEDGEVKIKSFKVNSKKRIKYITRPTDGSPDERISSRNMTVYEYAAIIGERAEMISKGSPIHPKYKDYVNFDFIEIAELELNDRDIPFPLLIHRPIDNPTYGKVFEVFSTREPDFRLPQDQLNYRRSTPVPRWRL